MIKMTMALVATMMIAFVARPCFGDLIFEVDLDSSTDGIQNTLAASDGATITADVWLTLTGTTSLSSYSFTMTWDTSELSAISRLETRPAGMFQLAPNAGKTINQALGRAVSFDGAIFGVGPVAPFSQRVATVTFNVLSPTGTPMDLDISVGAFNTGVDAYFDNNSNPINQVAFRGASITAVPEPSSATLIIGCMASFALVRRRSMLK